LAENIGSAADLLASGIAAVALVSRTTVSRKSKVFGYHEL
jgi:hypothetical protein